MSGTCENNGIYTAGDYFFGCVNFYVPEEAAVCILANRGVSLNDEFSKLDKKTADLLKADLYVWICMGPSKVNSVTDSDNGWSHSEGGYTLTDEDKERMLGYANAIYEEYDEENPADPSVVVTVDSFGVMRADEDIIGNLLPHTAGF